MGKIKYSMKEVLKLLEITEGTIRNYEKRGLIHSDREKNNYREFSYRDLNRIVTVRHFRDLGFSLDQIKDLMYSNSFTNTKEVLLTQHEATLKEAYNLLEKADKLNIDILKLTTIEESLDKYRIIDRPNYEFTEYSKNLNSDIFEKFDNFASFISDKDFYKNVAPSLGYVKKLGDNFKDKKCLYTVIKVDPSNLGKEGINSLLVNPLNYIKEHNYQVDGGVISIKLFTFEEEVGQVDYWALYFPII